MPRKIEIYPYDGRWPELFAAESPRVKAALGDNCTAIYHMGSTSVPGLAAKPIIDMMPVVTDIGAVDLHNAALQALGYIPRGENGIPFRRFFQKNAADFTYYAHVFENGNPEIARHIIFRDYLQTHSADREAYARLKQQLAQQFTYDIDGYINGKQGLIDSIIQKAGFNGGYRLIMAHSEREWTNYHRIRDQQYFKAIGVIYDLKQQTLAIPDHYHFLFMNKSDVIGTLHIELVKYNKCFIRALAIDKIYQRKGYGIELLKLAEKWIQQQNYSLIQLHARTDLLPFYEKAGYNTMPFEDPAYEAPKSSVNMGKFIV